jgi:hypothetical protein
MCKKVAVLVCKYNNISAERATIEGVSGILKLEVRTQTFES